MRYKANWNISGLKGKELKPGDTIELTKDQAAPYIGGCLSLVEGKADAADEGSDEGKSETETSGASDGTGGGEPPKAAKRSRKKSADSDTE